MGLWESEYDKLQKSGRKWAESVDRMPYRCAELFCENCGKSLGVFDIVCTNLESNMYCGDCVQKYQKDVPRELDCGTIVSDNGATIDITYKDNYYVNMTVSKTCYFNKKGRYVKIKGKRYYL